MTRLGHRQYLIKYEGEGIRAKYIVNQYVSENTFSSYTIGKIKMRKILIRQGFIVVMTRMGMTVKLCKLNKC